MEKLSIFGGTGFVGSKFVERRGGNIIPREANTPLTNDVVYFISTTHNYNVFTDVHLDINTNLNKLMDVLPNVKGTFNFISSWFVYGNGYDAQTKAATETSPCNPKGFYSITKKAAEDLIVSYCEVNNINYRIIRLCNVIGGDQSAGAKKLSLIHI
jgi:nucleoside-diphosphate-sugar epimerase